MKTIGIVGGGQLGLMLTKSAQKLGFKVFVLDPTEKCPASWLADKHVLGSFKDKQSVIDFSKECDVLTFEIESVNVEALHELELSHFPVYPSSNQLKIIKDKFAQKSFLQLREIPLPAFGIIANVDDAREFGRVYGYPFMLKKRHGGYDGRGNRVVVNENSITNAMGDLGLDLYAESFVPFVKELSVVSTRSQNGKEIFFDVVETIHQNNICHIVRCPAKIPDKIKNQARSVAEAVITKLGSVGTIAVELFLTKDEKIFVNEVAPRVHNSGHHTIEAFSMSQFEAHIRAITGMDIPEPIPVSKASVMINILGDRSGQADPRGMEEAEALGDVFIHIYGKLEVRPERKMGHITVLADTVEEAESKAILARKLITI